jgi:hypothetical protein
MNAATSGLILAGLVAFFGLVAALFYLALEDLADENIHLWYKALCYVLSAFAVLSAVLVFLRFSLLPSRLKDNHTESARLSRMDMAMGGLIVTGLVALIVLVTALAYFGKNILDRPRRELVVFDSWNWDTLCEKRLSTSKTSRTAANSWLSFAGLMALCVARDAIPVTWSISKRPVSGSATASTIARSSA